MARLLVLTDLPPDDTAWKGALTWRIILSLAESHHEVMVLTPVELEKIQITHPRLLVTRPVDSWRVDQLPMIAKVLLTYQPQIIHSFAFQARSGWPSLSVWPYLNAMTKVIPNLRRFSTLFEDADCALRDPSLIWHRGSLLTTVFSEQHKARVATRLGGQVEVLPLDLEFKNLESDSQNREALIPAPVSEWKSPEHGLKHLAEFLLRYPETSVRIVGGWGDWPQSRRKDGWQILASVAEKVSMTEALSFAKLISELRSKDMMWLEPLCADSWKYLLCSQLALQLNKKIFITSHKRPELMAGSTANSLSRLYSGGI